MVDLLSVYLHPKEAFLLEKAPKWRNQGNNKVLTGL